MKTAQAGFVRVDRGFIPVYYMRVSLMARIAFKLFDIGLICALALLSTGAHADKAGDALLQKCMQATARARTLQADFTTRLGFGPETTKVHGLLQLQKPN